MYEEGSIEHEDLKYTRAGVSLEDWRMGFRKARLFLGKKFEPLAESGLLNSSKGNLCYKPCSRIELRNENVPRQEDERLGHRKGSNFLDEKIKGFLKANLLSSYWWRL